MRLLLRWFGYDLILTQPIRSRAEIDARKAAWAATFSGAEIIELPEGNCS